MPDVDVAVIGAGISGLACAERLQRHGASVVVLESSPEVGGCITSVRSGEFLADGGPQTFARSPELTELIDNLGLGADAESAPAAARRYIYLSGKLVQLPSSPRELLRSPILSIGAKLRLLGERFVPRRRSDSDESVAAFVERRAGRDVLDRVAEPFVAGIFAGDPKDLSVRSAFPALVQLERAHGSILRAAQMRRSAPHAETLTFTRGNQLLPVALHARLGPAVRLNTPVSGIAVDDAGVMVDCSGSMRTKVYARAVVIATPADSAAGILAWADPEAAAILRAIEHAPVAQIAIAYPRDAIGQPLDGFGFLAARGQGLRILGAVWTSAIASRRAPDDQALVTAFLGGAMDRAIAKISDAELASIAHSDLRRAMIIPDVRPNVVAGFRWDRAIPQYTLGHSDRVRRIETALARHPNIQLAGNFLSGISVTDCLKRSRLVADAVVRAL